MRKVLVTGGAGYIGAHMVNHLLTHGYVVEIIDDFSTGVSNRIPRGVRIYDRSIEDISFLDALLADGKFSAVFHFAGLKSVEKSMHQEEKYMQVNFDATTNLVDLVIKHNIPKMIFSSSAAVYGNHASASRLRESDNLKPINPYGLSKLLSEEYISSIGSKQANRFIILRYFNVVGASSHDLCDLHGENLFPLIVRSLKEKSLFTIFGDDFPTRDGTALRDYIHVQDLIDVHLMVLEKNLSSENFGQLTFNVGSGDGQTVLEIVNSFEEVTGMRIFKKFGPRRLGDPGEVIADTRKLSSYINWEPKFSLKQMVESTWINSI